MRSTFESYKTLLIFTKGIMGIGKVGSVHNNPKTHVKLEKRKRKMGIQISS